MLDAIIENKDAKGNKQEKKKNKSFSIIIPFFVSEMRITYIRFFITLIFKLLRSNGIQMDILNVIRSVLDISPFNFCTQTIPR